MKKGFDRFLEMAFRNDRPQVKNVNLTALKAGIARRIENRLLRFRTLFIRSAIAAAVMLVFGFFMFFHATVTGHPDKVFYASHIEVFEKMDLYENFDVISDYNGPDNPGEISL